MQITFFGAAREVTGSMHLLTHGNDRILLDCGMFQGRRKQSAEKNRQFPVDPKSVTNLVLSHAHIDHSGRIPVLAKGGFPGRVFCTRATEDACRYLLADSARIQESDAQYLNYKTVRAYFQQHPELLKTRKRKANPDDAAFIRQILKKNRHEIDAGAIEDFIAKYRIPAIRPLYTSADADAALQSFEGLPYGHPASIGRDITCTFYEAGHILGSAFSLIRFRQNGRQRLVGYTGDIGRPGKPIIKDPNLVFPKEDRQLDLLIMESTYGDRLHEPVADLKTRLGEIINQTWDRGGSVIIPSFAFGRTQEIIYILHELYNAGKVPALPVYVDSPLAVNLTRVFGEHPEVYDKATHETFLMQSENPFAFKQIQYIQSVEASMALMREKKPHIVIASSGMCEAGRVLHHLRNKIHNPAHTILIVGFMAENTLGRRIQDQGLAYAEAGRKGAPPLVKFLNKEYPLAARVAKLDGFSAHADRDELMAFLEKSNLKVNRIAVVHGEASQAISFGDHLKAAGYDAVVPQMGDTLEI